MTVTRILKLADGEELISETTDRSEGADDDPRNELLEHRRVVTAADGAQRSR